ncbi:hypothetical protein [Streptomyces sp. NPDC005407]|uniref:hypothetical protein n=1 Tax=Streptomyces sp. NPDC005407 TaxID=3155340 RepID=UPI00339E2DAF
MPFTSVTAEGMRSSSGRLFTERGFGNTGGELWERQLGRSAMDVDPIAVHLLAKSR